MNNVRNEMIYVPVMVDGKWCVMDYVTKKVSKAFKFDNRSVAASICAAYMGISEMREAELVWAILQINS